ncbi:MAG: cyclic peptide export ABC transporter [Polyangiales bacterium]
MSLLWQLAAHARIRLFVALGASVLGGFGSASLVALINEALTASRERRLTLALEFAALAVLVPALRWLSQSQFLWLAQSALMQLRVQLSRHFAHAPFSALEKSGAGKLLSTLVSDAFVVSEFFVVLPRLSTQGAIVLGGFGYLAYLSWRALALALALVVVGTLVHFAAVGQALGRLERARDEEDALFGHFRALVAGAKELKLNRLRREAFVSDVLARSVESVRDDRTRGLNAFVGAGSFGAFMFFVVIGGVIFGLSTLTDVPATVRSGFALVFLYIMFPLEDVLEAFPEFARTNIAVDRVMEVAGGDLGARFPRPVQAVKAEARIALEGVTHRYRREHEDGEFTFGPIDLSLAPGEVVFVVGGNGSGKTTLAKLLVGLYAPASGRVLLDGAPIEEAQREHYRQHFSAVFSDFHLFDALLGMGEAPSTAEREALDAAASALLVALQLDHKVQVRGGRLSTTALSSGQRKRLALMVACLEDRPVCVFDEWAADQDPVFKRVFYTEVLPALKARGKAVLVITHDDRYFHLADRCLKLESGREVRDDAPARDRARVRAAFADVPAS